MNLKVKKIRIWSETGPLLCLTAPSPSRTRVPVPARNALFRGPCIRIAGRSPAVGSGLPFPVHCRTCPDPARDPLNVATSGHCRASSDASVDDQGLHLTTLHLSSPTLLTLTCVGLAFSLGKLILAGFNCKVDGLHGVGGSLLPWPRLVTRTG